jgi:type II secretory pathway component GspD/PulD (secretin)
LNYTRFVRGKEQSGSLQQVSTNVFDPKNLSYGVTMPAPNPTLFGNPLRPDANDGPANGIQTQAGAGLVANVISPDYGTVEAIFRGIEQRADADLISKPEILVIDNGSAEIHAGSQIPYQNIAYSVYGTQLNVTWKNIGVNFKLKPLILPNDTVQIDIEQLGVSDVIRIDNIRGIDLPVFATREQSGMVIVPNNQTLVIGGLSSRVIQKTERRVPVVGALPLVGIPFRGRASKASNSLLLIFVSPTVVNLRALTPEAQDALEFWRNQDWENKERISKEIQVMQEEP